MAAHDLRDELTSRGPENDDARTGAAKQRRRGARQQVERARCHVRPSGDEQVAVGSSLATARRRARRVHHGRPPGAPRGTGGWCATIRDFARIGQLVIEDGRGIVPKDWLTDIWENGDRDAWRQGEFAAGFFGISMIYRSGWYVMHGTQPMIFAMGIHGQNLFIDRRRKLVIAMQSSWGKAIDIHNLPRTHTGVEEIRNRIDA